MSRQTLFLEKALARGNNNFDVLRLVAALAVIVGHAHALIRRPAPPDLVSELLRFDYSGSLAVKFFFFLSGLLVANSLLEKPDLVQFVANRALRILPGLFVCLVLTTFVLGPIATTLPLGAYLKHPDTLGYFGHNLALGSMRFRLPGVFEHSQFGVNGSLWTLPFEVRCYLWLAVVGGVGLLRSRWTATAILVGVIGAAFLAPERIPYFGPVGEAQLLPACFAMGALAALYKSSLPLGWQPAAALWLLVAIAGDPTLHRFAFYLALFYTSLVVAAEPFVVRRLRLPFDASYGVYVYGFPVQQALFAAFPRQQLHVNQLLAGAIATGLGVASWYLVEKPSLSHGRRLVKALVARIEQGNLSALLAELRRRAASAIARRERWELAILLLVAIAAHALVLRAVFPGYYSPLRPHHADFYVPVALRHMGMGLLDALRGPRPTGMLFFVAAGRLGIEGSIAAVLALVFLNVALTALVLRRAAGAAFDGPFLAAFGAFAFLVFSQPFLYGFYTQDAFAHLSYLLLVAGVWYLQRRLASAPRRALAVLALLALAAFLAKETFAPAALLLAGGWAWSRRRDGLLRAAGPALALGGGLAAALALNRLAGSPFIENPEGAAAPYRIDASPASVLGEWTRYAAEGLTPATLALVVAAAAFVAIASREPARRRLALLLPLAATLAWLPNSLLPNHHFAGYSSTGAALLFAPVLMLGAVWGSAGVRARWAAAALLALALASPRASASRFQQSGWVLGQEAIQRNLLRVLRWRVSPPPASGTERVLVTGIDFPFSPFDHPASLAEFPRAARRSFDVVAYAPRPGSGPTATSRFVRPADVEPGRYDRVWAFRPDGTLLADEDRRERLARRPGADDLLEPADLLLYPQLLETFGIAEPAGVRLAEHDAARLFRCGTRLLDLGEAALAARCLAASARRDPTNPYAHYFLGLAHERQGHGAMARQAVEKAVALDAGAAPNAAFRDALSRLRSEIPGGSARAE